MIPFCICSNGADRSAIFVAIAILAQQMMKESRVDVFSVARKLRSQRQGLFRNFVSTISYQPIKVHRSNSWKRCLIELFEFHRHSTNLCTGLWSHTPSYMLRTEMPGIDCEETKTSI